MPKLLFSDDLKIYLKVFTEHDAQILQKLYTLSDLCTTSSLSPNTLLFQYGKIQQFIRLFSATVLIATSGQLDTELAFQWMASDDILDDTLRQIYQESCKTIARTHNSIILWGLQTKW